MISQGKWSFGKAIAMSAVIVLTQGMGAGLAFGGPIENVIEIDGNPQDGPEPGLDWCCLDDKSPVCIDDARVKKFSKRVFDLCPDVSTDPNAISTECQSFKEVRSIFKQDSKDVREIGEPDGDWVHETNAPNDKTDIVNAMAALLVDQDSGDQILAFAGDRFAIEGTAQIGVWFFQNAISPRTEDNRFDGLHKVGDILVIAEFVRGGRVSQLQICEWQGEDNVPCVDITNNQNADASSNVEEVTACWQYRTKNRRFPAQTYPVNAFFSGAMNLTQLSMDGTCVNGVCEGGAHSDETCTVEADCDPVLNDPPGCLATFLLETRTSQSIEATLKDFALGEFDTCAGIHGKKQQVDNDGTCASNPVNLPDWEIRLLDENGALVTVDGNGELLDNPVCTDGSGEYWFMNLPINVNYTVCEVVPDSQPDENFDWRPCLPDPGNAGALDTLGNCAAGGGDEFCYDPFLLRETVTGMDFHNFKRVIPSQLSGVKFCDEDGDQARAPAEVGVKEFCIILTKPDGSKEYALTAPGPDPTMGSYSFLVDSGATYIVDEDVTGQACRDNGFPQAPNYSDGSTGDVWIPTTKHPFSVEIPARLTSADVPPIGNTTIPTITCPAGQTIKKAPGTCEADFCFTPVADNECGDKTVVCTATGGVTLTQTGDEWCGTFPGPSGDPTCSATTTVTCTVTTEAGQTDGCPFDVTVQDNGDPDLTVENVKVSCKDPTDPDSIGGVTCSDNCDPDPVLTFTDVVEGNCPVTITRTWTCTDKCGNTSSADQIITINDFPPDLTVPPPAKITCKDDSSPAGTGEATCSDNCEAGSITATFSDVVSGNCPKVITRTWTCTDKCNNSTSADQIITINDDIDPVLTLPADIKITCKDDSSPAGTGEATCSDNCEAGSITATFSDEVSANCPKVITRTWTCTDKCNNSTSADQIITINDEIDPVLTLPADVKITCKDDSSPAGTGEATCSDNCDQGAITATFSDVTSGNCPVIITRTWTCRDKCGNTSSEDQIITINDDIPPVLTLPDDVKITCKDPTEPGFTGEATCSDNCDQGAITATFSDEVSGNCPATIVRTWTCRDKCNNSSSADQTITVNDDIPPVLTLPDDVKITCEDPTDPGFTGVGTCSDNCDPDPITATFSDEVSGNCPATIVRTWTCMDKCGNSSSADQTITINDDIPPVLTLPADVKITCKDDSSPAGTGEATCSDNCDQGAITATFSDVLSDNCPKMITRTWTCRDKCGNSSSADQVITINDDIPPVLTLPDDAKITCKDPTDPDFTGEATCSDNCDQGAITATFSDVTSGNCPVTIVRTWTCRDKCGNTSSADQVITINDDIPPVLTLPDDVKITCKDDSSPAGTGEATCSDNCDQGAITATFSDVTSGNCPVIITRTWTCTDKCGNSTSDDQIITINDDIDPVLTLPDDVKITCKDDSSPDFTGEATCSDNCDQGAITATFSDVTLGNCPVIITRTWTCTDKCNNSSSADQIITINDDFLPTVTCPGEKLEAICEEQLEFKVNANDNCDPDLAVACWIFDNTGPGGASLEQLDPPMWGITLDGTTTATVRCDATDKCGNVSEFCEFTVNTGCHEACSPGFWRNHDDDWCEPQTPLQPVDGHCGAPTPFAATLFLEAFGNLAACPGEAGLNNLHDNPGLTLLEAVSSSGKDNQTLFHCSAALLSSYAVNFPVVSGAVIDVIRDACTGSVDFDGTAVSWRRAFDICKVWNDAEDEGGCPLGSSPSLVPGTSELSPIP